MQHVVKNVTRRLCRLESLVVLAAVTVPLLAVLQYRWLSELGAAQRTDMQRGWQEAVDRSAAAINTDVSTFYAAIVAASQDQPGSGGVREAIARWRRTATTLGPLANADLHDRGSEEANVPYAATWILPAGSRHLPAMAITLPDGDGDFGAVVMSFDTRACEPLLHSLAASYFASDSDVRLAIAARGERIDAPVCADEQFEPGRPAETHSRVFALRPPESPRARAIGQASVGIVMSQAGGPAWNLYAQHGDGGVAATVTRFQLRNWWIAAGLELILVAAIVALIAAARRARQTADAHLTFAAVVAHEIRTPLAAIKVLAQNQAHGIVKSDEQIAEYGKTIAAEASRLHEFVEHVLRLTTASAGRRGGRARRNRIRPGANHDRQ